MIRLVPDSASRREIDQMTRTFQQLMYRIGSREQGEIRRAVSEGFADNFGNEGDRSGPWARLAPGTIADRLAKGFGPGPILVRTGDYRSSFINSGNPEHHHQVSVSSTLFAQEEGSTHALAPFHEQGTRNMPARPVTDLSPRSEDRIGQVIDGIMDRLLRR